MLSAKRMCEIATSSTSNVYLKEVEDKITDAANHGKFFVKLFDVTEPVDSSQLAIMKKYGSEVYRMLEILGYVTVLHEQDGVVGVYVGFAHSNAKFLENDIKMSKS